MPELVRKTLRDNRGSTIGWGVALVASLALQLAVYPTVKSMAADFTRLIDGYPEAFKALFGATDSFTTGVGYLNGEVFGFLAPLVLVGVAVGQAARATAGEERDGTLDLLLANPVSRTRLLADKSTAVLAAVLALAAALAAAIIIGGPLVGLDVPAAQVLAGCLATALVALPFGALALLVAAAFGRPGLAVAVSVGLALLTFLVESLSPVADVLTPWRSLSPFHHAAIGDALAGHPSWTGFAVLVALTAALFSAAALTFDHHDIRVA